MEATGDIQLNYSSGSWCYLNNGLPLEEKIVLSEMLTSRMPSQSICLKDIRNRGDIVLEDSKDPWQVEEPVFSQPDYGRA